MQFQVMRLPVSAKQAWEQEVVIASLFCHRTSPQAEKGGRAEPGLGGDVTTLMTIPGPGITWPRQLTYLANTQPESDLAWPT